MLSEQEVLLIKAAVQEALEEIPGWTYSGWLFMADRETHSVFIKVGKTLNLRGPRLSGEMIDVSSHFSSGWREEAGLQKSGGLVQFRLHFAPTESTHGLATGLAAAALDQSMEQFHLVYADGCRLEFWAYVSLEFIAPVNGPLMAEVELEVSGPISLY